MLQYVRGLVLCAVLAAPLSAQQPDSTRRPPLSPADSAKAVRDSIALMRELEKAQQPTTTASPTAGGAQGPTNPRMIPDISAVGDLVGDFSPKGSTQEDGSRFGAREVELAVQAAVDPYFRGDVFLGISDLEGLAIEQAYLTATALPYQLEARLGRFLMPFGKQNTTHRHDLHTVEYPYVLQRFLGEEGLKGTGIYVSKVVAPFGFYQELLLTAIDRLGEAPEGLITDEPVNQQLGGMGFSARLRNYWDLSQSTNIEFSASAATGKREQPVAVVAGEPNAILARQSLAGVDFTFRWRPLQQGLYKSFILQAEVLRQLNERVGVAGYEGPQRDLDGAYLFARWQLTRRLYLGGRYDWVQDPELTLNSPDARTLTAGSGYLEWFPSEFSKLVAAFERRSPQGEPGVNRILLQATFALGPHKPHPF
jgi:hypothetical protein